MVGDESVLMVVEANDGRVIVSALGSLIGRRIFSLYLDDSLEEF